MGKMLWNSRLPHHRSRTETRTGAAKAATTAGLLERWLHSWSIYTPYAEFGKQEFRWHHSVLRFAAFQITEYFFSLLIDCPAFKYPKAAPRRSPASCR